MWKLGGKDSSFRMGRGADFFYQHFAVRQKDGTLTLFDNGAMDRDKSHTRHSEAKQLRIDTRRHTATLVRSFKAPPGSSLATSQGSASVLGNENVFVGWGISPWFSEYAPDGRLLFAGRFQSVWHHSYRAFKSDWHATPGSDPAIAARVSKGSVAAYASWNGATEVTSWRLMGGSDPDNLSAIGSVPWANFETRMVFPGEPAYVEAQALDAAGTVIGLSAVIKPTR